MKESTFVVTAADAETATLRDVYDQQVVTLGENPGVEAGEVLEATVEPEPPLEVAYRVVEIASQRSIPVERSDLSPTTQAEDLAAEQSVGEITRRERAGEGEIHVLTVPVDDTEDADEQSSSSPRPSTTHEDAAADVADDDATLERAARLGVDRVAVRAADGVVSVRYLPD